MYNESPNLDGMDKKPKITFSKKRILCCIEERNAYTFGTTWLRNIDKMLLVAGQDKT